LSTEHRVYVARQLKEFCGNRRQRATWTLRRERAEAVSLGDSVGLRRRIGHNSTYGGLLPEAVDMTQKPLTTHGSSRSTSSGSDDSLEISTDAGLRAALGWVTRDQRRGPCAAWEAVGSELLTRAQRQSWRWPRHASDFVGGYVVGALDALTDRPESVRHARSPWAMVDTIGRRAGARAVGEAVTGGLVARDPQRHRVRLSVVPKVVSLELLADTGVLERAV
jgi:hypothetical protein